MSASLSHGSEEFAAFYSRNFTLVYRLCFAYMKNASDAEDCAADVFVKVLTGDRTFNDADHERAWLTVTAINLCKDRLKQWWRRNTVSMEACPEVGAEADYEIDETLGVVLSLPARYKDVVYLYYYMGYATDDIARLLKRNASTVRNHLSEARRILREKLGGDFN
ncbi:MAG: RNA polymerase sigma factor [Clostridia bacterium]|nr:RNA polymerase sigma factor [Clostridia bacterium]